MVFCLTWIVLIVMLFRRQFLIHMALILLLVLNLAIGGSFLVTAYHLYFQKQGVIVSPVSIARKGPALAYDKVYEEGISGGTEFRYLDTSGQWWRIELKNGSRLWIEAADASLI